MRVIRWTPLSTEPLPVINSQEILRVLEKFANAERRLSDLDGRYFATVCFDETNRQSDGTIRRETRSPKELSDWVVSGPHFFVGNPFCKTPNEGCSTNRDYAPIDLTEIPDDYLPRTNYVRACSKTEYEKRTPYWNGKPVTTFYRHVHRRMIAPTGERTIIPCIIPPGPAHINTVFAIAFAKPVELVLFNAMMSSVVVDFFAKTTGKSDARQDLILQFPMPTRFIREMMVRALRLNCLTTAYADLWQELWEPVFADECFSKTEKGSRLWGRLPIDGLPSEDFLARRNISFMPWSHLTKTWSHDSALRTPYERRQALVELDALAALNLGLTEDELLTLYRVQFPVVQQYERETYYDQRGHIVFTTNRGLSGVGLDRKQWEGIKRAKDTDELPDFARGYIPPFDRCDREEDMATAYRFFSQCIK